MRPPTQPQDPGAPPLNTQAITSPSGIASGLRPPRRRTRRAKSGFASAEARDRLRSHLIATIAVSRRHVPTVAAARGHRKPSPPGARRPGDGSRGDSAGDRGRPGLLAPEHADGIFRDFTPEVGEPARWPEQWIAFPPARVTVVVEGPQTLRRYGSQPRDRQPRPLGAVVLAPRRAALDGIHRLAFLLELDSDVLACLRRNASVAERLDSGHIGRWKHQRHRRAGPKWDSVLTSLGTYIASHLWPIAAGEPSLGASASWRSRAGAGEGRNRSGELGLGRREAVPSIEVR